MSTHNICFNGELTKIILQLSSNTRLICPFEIVTSLLHYHKYPTFSDRKVWAKSLVEDKTAPSYLDTLLHGKTTVIKFKDNYSILGGGVQMLTVLSLISKIYWYALLEV